MGFAYFSWETCILKKSLQQLWSSKDLQSKVHQTKKATIEIGQWVVAGDIIFLLSGAVQHLPAAIHAPATWRSIDPAPPLSSDQENGAASDSQKVAWAS